MKKKIVLYCQPWSVEFCSLLSDRMSLLTLLSPNFMVQSKEHMWLEIVTLAHISLQGEHRVLTFFMAQGEKIDRIFYIQVW